MSSVTYGLGGYRPAHPSQGKIEEHADATSTVTRWNDVGTVIDVRPYTADEQAQADAVAAGLFVDGAKRTVAERAQAALTTNATFLAINSPTNAQTLAQVRALTRECSGLIRMALNQFDSTDGT
jgi:hypothetical protein